MHNFLSDLQLAFRLLAKKVGANVESRLLPIRVAYPPSVPLPPYRPPQPLPHE